MYTKITDFWGFRVGMAIFAIVLLQLFFIGQSNIVRAEEEVLDYSTTQSLGLPEFITETLAPIVEQANQEPVEEVAPIVDQENQAVEESTGELPTEQTVAEQSPEQPSTEQVVNINPELSTDKEDYHPGETASIFGKFFGALQDLVIKVFGSDENGQNYTETTETITTDANGEFSFDYLLDSLYRPFYEVVVSTLSGETVAETWFRDSSVGTYDQCSNDDGDGFSGNPGICDWTNGNIQSNNSTYFEGESTVQRLWIEGFAPGNHTVTLQYGTTKGAKHAYDFLTTWNDSENWITESDRCSGITGCVGLSESSLNIPEDPNVPDAFETAVGSREFKMRGGSLVSATTPVLASGSYGVGDSETAITVTFNVPASGPMCKTSKVQGQNITSCGVVLWFGAHIANGEDWTGPEGDGFTGATDIPGSPYHVALDKIDGASAGQRDNQMQAAAIVVPTTGHIVVDKVTNPSGDTQSFNFIAGGTGYNDFSLTDQSPLDDQELVAGTYSVTEEVPAGWDQTSVVCNSSTGGTENPASISLQAEEVVTCVFTNTKRGQLIVQKTTLPSGDSTSFAITAEGTGTISGGGSGSVTDSTDQNYEVTPGTYSVTEEVPSGWIQTGNTCTNVVVAAGESKTCIITNTKKGRIIVDKVTNPSGDAQSFDFNASGGAYLDFSLTDTADANDQALAPGNYAVTEDAVTGWVQTGASCISSLQNTEFPNQLNLNPGEIITCTFTNTKQAHIIVNKVTVGGTGTFNFDATGDNYNDFSLSGGGSNNQTVAPGTYSITESVLSGWVLTSAVCDQGETIESIDVAPGETVTCTFTNTKQGKIVIEKQTSPDGSNQSFSFDASYDQDGFNLTDGQQNDSGFLNPGTYSVSEDALEGWDLTNVVCDDGSQPTNIDLSAGEVVTCVFTNRQDGKIIVKKETLPEGSQQLFGFTATYGSPFNLADGQQNDSGFLNPGTYEVSEDVLEGWDLTSAICQSSIADEETPSTLELDPGETITCTFTNTQRGEIVVEKQTLPDGDSATFNFTGDVTTALGDGQTANLQVIPGAYSVTESTKTDWTLTGLVCSDANSTENLQTRTANFNVEPGEVVTCVFTNTYTPPLSVTKTAETTYTRTYGWEIDKSVTPPIWHLFNGDSGTSEYTVNVTKDNGTDSDWKVTGEIKIHNSAATVAIVEDVTDAISGGINATVNCGGTFPIVIAPTEHLMCTYTADLPNGNNRTNTATAVTSGLIAGDSGEADVMFGEPSSIVDGAINIDDTNGSTWAFNDTGSVSYSRTFSCNEDEGIHDNTATIRETEASASASVEVRCHDLEVSKTANTSYNKDWAWTIDKTGDKTTLTLAPDATYPVNYTVSVNGSFTNNDFAASGVITIKNTSSMTATINSVADVMGSVSAAVDCGVSYPYSLTANSTLTCTYQADLPDNTNLTNTATATLQNYDYDKDLTETATTTTVYSGTANVDFASAVVTEIDECINVTDDKKGALGTVCGTDTLPKVFNYQMLVGPYTDADCGLVKAFDNTASFVTNDTPATGSDSHTVNTSVVCTCTLTQGYWKTHNATFKGGTPVDPNWATIGDVDGDGIIEKEGETFFKSGKTWYQIFWTAPQGNVYYNLAHQYMAAKLNISSGAQAPANVTSAMTQAETWLDSMTPSQAKNLKGAAKNNWTNLAGILGSYNEGKIGPGHCSEVILP